MSSQLLVGFVTGLILAGVVSVLVIISLWFRTKVNANKGCLFPEKEDALVDVIERFLPQTQCGECSYNGCRPYAKAISRDEAEINQCPPGGEETIVQLGQLLGRDILPLNSEYGEYRPYRLAVIDEDQCIGCTKCIQACPVDAILGAARQMHTVISEHCTGCELCIPPCPVDCIDMLPPVYGQAQVAESGCHEKVI